MYKNLKKEMAAKGITVESLARLLGTHRNTIQNKLDGRCEFTFDQAQQIAELVFPEYRASYLFHRDSVDKKAV